MSQPELFYVSVDFHELATRFGAHDPALRRLIEGEDAEPPDEGTGDHDREGQMEQLLELLELLPPKEADMIRMYYLDHKMQDDIGYVHGCTQAAVSYRISRAISRLKFLAAVPKLTDAEIEALLTPHFGEMDMLVLLAYRHTASQSKTADQLGISQGRVRHRLIKSVTRLEKLAERDSSLREVCRLFVMFRDNPNVLYEVVLPQWANQGKATRDDTFAK